MKKRLLWLTVIIIAFILLDSFSSFNLISSIRKASLDLPRLLAGGPAADLPLFQSEPSKLEGYRALADRVALEKENQDLRALLNFQEHAQKKLHVAQVLYRDPLAPSYFYIAIGSGGAIRTGQAVITPDGFLIGRVAAIYSTTAQVERVSNAGFKLAASLLHESSTVGLLRGNNGPFFLLELVPPTIAMMKEDIVVTANTDIQIPEGLLIGTVQTIDSNTDPLFQSASILPFYSSEELPRIVSIIVAE